jgi:K+-transporting ATPase KdpF subunit
MRTKTIQSLMSFTVLTVNSDKTISNGTTSYLVGGIIALFIMCYLIYTLFRPEKF